MTVIDRARLAEIRKELQTRRLDALFIGRPTPDPMYLTKDHPRYRLRGLLRRPDYTGQCLQRRTERQPSGQVSVQIEKLVFVETGCSGRASTGLCVNCWWSDKARDRRRTGNDKKTPAPMLLGDRQDYRRLRRIPIPCRSPRRREAWSRRSPTPRPRSSGPDRREERAATGSTRRCGLS